MSRGYTIMDSREFIRRMGFDEALVAVLDEPDWQDPRHLRVLANAIMTAGRSGDHEQVAAHMSFLGGIAAAALAEIAKNIEADRTATQQ
jgi:hypothetical protein